MARDADCDIDLVVLLPVCFSTNYSEVFFKATSALTQGNLVVYFLPITLPD